MNDDSLSQDDILREAEAIRAALLSSAEPSERSRLKARYQELDALHRKLRKTSNTASAPEAKDTRACPYCAETIKVGAVKCRFCGEFLDGRERETIAPSVSSQGEHMSTMGTRSSVEMPTLLGLSGSGTLFVGTFMPIIKAPLIGSINYFKNGEGDGVIIIVLACIALALTLTKNTRWVYIPGLLAGAVLAYTFYNLRVSISDARNELGDSGIFGEAFAETIQMDWGWSILILGVVLLFSASALYKRPAKVISINS